MSKSKAIGTKAETAVVKAARVRGFGQADRHPLKGSLDEGDVWLCPGVIVQVKGGEMARSASDNLIEDWLAETAVQVGNARARLGLLVIQRRGVGEANAHRWWAVWRLRDLVEVASSHTAAFCTGVGAVRMTFEQSLILLRQDGWGDSIVPCPSCGAMAAIDSAHFDGDEYICSPDPVPMEHES